MLTIYIANILHFVSGATLTWSSSELPLLSNTTTSPFKRKLTSEEVTWISSLVTLGAAIGPFFFTYLADKMGRKYTVLSAGVPFLVCYLILAFGKTVELFYVARFITGVTVGGIFTVVSIYICEIAEKSHRGVLGLIGGLALCSGLLFSCSLGPYVSVMVFNLVLALFSLLFLVVFSFLGKEVPHYYISINENELAKEALQKIRRDFDDIDEELDEIQRTVKGEGKGSFSDIFRSKGLVKAFITSVGLLVFQQFSGINIVLFYGQQIFQEIGSNLTPEICIIIVSGMQFLSSAIAPLLGDKLGRKTLLMISAIGMAISEALLGVYSYLKDHSNVNMDDVSFLPLLIMTCFIVLYNTGYGPLPWCMLGELFPSKVKSIATSTVTCICWLLAFFLTKHFETMLKLFGVPQYFWMYAVCCVLAAAFAKFYVIETRGKSLQQIQKELNS